MTVDERVATLRVQAGIIEEGIGFGLRLDGSGAVGGLMIALVGWRWSPGRDTRTGRDPDSSRCPQVRVKRSSHWLARIPGWSKRACSGRPMRRVLPPPHILPGAASRVRLLRWASRSRLYRWVVCLATMLSGPVAGRGST